MIHRRRPLLSCSISPIFFSVAAVPAMAELEQRIDADRPPIVLDHLVVRDPIPMIQPGGPPDSCENRVDPNVARSPYAGVASVLAGGDDDAFGTAAAVSPTHVLTSAHLFDADSDGDNDIGTDVTITFNADGDASVVIHPQGIEAVDLHPDFTGFATPAVNDDLALITLTEPLPETIPFYPISDAPVEQGQMFTIVGYGVCGEQSLPDPSIKRVGGNAADMFTNDDEGDGAVEVFQYDFDGPTEALNCFGGGTLGNDIETTLSPGDSGAPSLIEDEQGRLRAWGVNTFAGGCINSPPFFGSSAGGMINSAYLDWFSEFLPPNPFPLLAPEDGQNDVPVNPLVQWADALFAGTYTLTVSTEPDLSDPIVEQTGLASTSFYVPSGTLSPQTQYFLSVEAVNANGSTDASPEVVSFTTGSLGDLTGDGAVDGADLGALLGQWGECSAGAGCPADLNGDGVVDGADLGALLGDWG